MPSYYLQVVTTFNPPLQTAGDLVLSPDAKGKLKAQFTPEDGGHTVHVHNAVYSNTGPGLDLVGPGGGQDAVLPDQPGCQGAEGRPIFQLTLNKDKHSKLRAKPAEVEDWDELLRHWRAVLGGLAAQYLAGDARVDPLKGECAYCHLAGTCRIRELDGAAANEADEEGA